MGRISTSFLENLGYDILVTPQVLILFTVYCSNPYVISVSMELGLENLNLHSRERSDDYGVYMCTLTTP
jgi:hypothetical protein